jgi:hypothetical protein
MYLHIDVIIGSLFWWKTIHGPRTMTSSQFPSSLWRYWLYETAISVAELCSINCICSLASINIRFCHVYQHTTDPAWLVQMWTCRDSVTVAGCWGSALAAERMEVTMPQSALGCCPELHPSHILTTFLPSENLYPYDYGLILYLLNISSIYVYKIQVF